MSISLVSFQVNGPAAGQNDEGWQQFMQLVRAVNAGDLAASRKAHESFGKSPAAGVAQSNPDGRLARALGALGAALQSGDVGAAQQALASIRPSAKPGAAPAMPPAVEAPGISPASPNAPGSKFDAIA